MTATLNDGFTQTTATGGETTIDFDFLIYGKDDIAFYETDLSGVISLLVRGTDYSIADGELLDPAGGEIVLDVGVYPTGATAGHKFTCISDIAETRSSDFQQGGDFFAQTLNTNLDRLTRVTQQLRRDVDKKAGLPVDSTLAGITFTDAPQDGYGVIWDGVLGSFRNTASSLAVLEGNAATVAGSIASVNTVATNIASVNTVAGISANVTTVAGIAAAVSAVAGISAAVSAVATVDTEVAALAPYTAEIADLGPIASSIVLAAAVDSEIVTVAGIAGNVTTVAGIAANVTTVAGISANVTTVAGISAAVSTVATNAAAVSTCATNIAAIIAAPAAATEAEHWAIYPEDSLVPEGNMTTEYSAYHWAQKASAAASGNGVALSVLGVTGNATAARADIAAGSDHQVLRRSGTALTFGALNLAQAAAVTGILPTANGGTSNGFFTVSGPASSAKTYTFPNASATVLTTNAAVTVAQGGTGIATTTAYGVICGGTTATGNFQNAGAGTLGQVLTSNGAAALPTWQTPGGGALRYVNSQVLGGAADTLHLQDCFSATYDTYLLHVRMKRAAASNSEPVFQLSDDSEATWETTGFTWTGWRANTGGNVTCTTQGTRNPMEIMNGAGVSANGGWCLFDLWLSVAGLEGTGDVHFEIRGYETGDMTSTTPGYHFSSAGTCNMSVLVNSFRLFFNNSGSPATSGVGTGSSVYCYGLTKS